MYTVSQGDVKMTGSDHHLTLVKQFFIVGLVGLSPFRVLKLDQRKLILHFGGRTRLKILDCPVYWAAAGLCMPAFPSQAGEFRVCRGFCNVL